MSQNNKYLCKRKWQAKKLSFLFIVMRLFPVRKNKVVFSTFEGDGGFCCNPRYIAEELYSRNKKLKLIWLTRKSSEDFPPYITVKKYSTLNIVYHLSTAKVWVDNYRKPFGTLKRKNQLYIQTWHASFGFKAVGLFRGSLFPPIARLVSEWDSNLIDYMVSNSAYCDRIYPKKILYNGPTIRSGSPRVDCLINQRMGLHNALCKKLLLDTEVHFLLFAPTFRGGNQKGKKNVVSENISIDFMRLFAILQKKFGGEWKILLRLHPQLSAILDKMPFEGKNENIIDVSQFSDMSQVLGASDILITDYSSCAFDAAFAKIPVFLYADDIQKYIADRGEFMWKREEIPFSIAETNEELEKNINDYSKLNYEKRIDCFMAEHEVLEDGHASERIFNFIENILCM